MSRGWPHSSALCVHLSPGYRTSPHSLRSGSVWVYRCVMSLWYMRLNSSSIFLSKLSCKFCRLASTFFARNYNYEQLSLSGKHAALTNVAADLCFLSQAEMTTFGDVKITSILQDSNYNTCLLLADKTGTRTANFNLAVTLQNNFNYSCYFKNKSIVVLLRVWRCPTFIVVAAVYVLLCVPLLISSWQGCAPGVATDVNVSESATLLYSMYLKYLLHLISGKYVIL